MEQSVETFVPSRLYARVGWAALAGTAISVLCGFRAPLAFIPGLLCGITAILLFWVASRPMIRIGETQFNIGERAVAWREVRELNSSRYLSPLMLKVRLTNNRKLLLVYPGEPERIEQLLFQLRKHSELATFDGVAHRDYWTWINLSHGTKGETPVLEQPVRMISTDEEDEIERMYQMLKTAGRIDSRVESSNTSDED